MTLVLDPRAQAVSLASIDLGRVVDQSVGVRAGTIHYVRVPGDSFGRYIHARLVFEHHVDLRSGRQRLALPVPYGSRYRSHQRIVRALCPSTGGRLRLLGTGDRHDHRQTQHQPSTHAVLPSVKSVARRRRAPAPSLVAGIGPCDNRFERPFAMSLFRGRPIHEPFVQERHAARKHGCAATQQ